MSFFEPVVELLGEIYFFIIDFKFWKKKKAQRKLEKKQGLPKKTMGLYPSNKIMIKTFLLFLVLMIPIFFLFFRNENKNKTEKKLFEIHELLEVEKNKFQLYPKELNTIIRKNPFRQDLTIDAWNNKFFYETTDNRLNYKLVSKGIDGILNTEDDIK